MGYQMLSSKGLTIRSHTKAITESDLYRNKNNNICEGCNIQKYKDRQMTEEEIKKHEENMIICEEKVEKIYPLCEEIFLFVKDVKHEKAAEIKLLSIRMMNTCLSAISCDVKLQFLERDSNLILRLIEGETASVFIEVKSKATQIINIIHEF
jgi:hypothetical protein